MQRKRPHRGHLRKRIILTQLVFAVIPFLGVLAIIHYSFIDRITKNYTDSLNTQLLSVSQAVDEKMSLYLNRSRLIAENNYCLSLLGGVVRGDYMQLLDLQNLLSSLTIDLIPPSLRDVNLCLYVDDYSFDSSSYVESMKNFSDEALKEQILRTTSREVTWADGLYSDNSGNTFIVFYRHLSSFSRDAILRVGIPYGEIEHILTRFNDENTGTVIIHRSATSELLFFKSNDHASKGYEVFVEEKYFLVYSGVLPDGSTMIAGLERRHIFKEYMIYYALTLLIAIVMIILILSASSMATARITKNLNHFIDTIIISDGVSNTEQSKSEALSYDEVEVIKERFYRILHERELAHQSLMEANSKNNLLEINLLQSRLNPHMLYNSLSTIRMCAMGNNNQKTMDIVDSLSKYYRLALNNGIDIITVRQEIDLITQYVDIVRLTYSKAYHLIVSVDEEVMEQRIIKHLLQPIIENALHHGLRGISGNAMVELAATMADGYLVFEITDNGFGMDEQTIQKVLRMEYESARGGFGIKSLIQKIALFYGGECGLTIQNNKKNGIKVIIKVALMQ